jgi:hypothetical protein
MSGCKAAAFRIDAVYDGTRQVLTGCAFTMAKKYELVRDKVPLPGGGFAEALRMALVDFSCLGQGRHFDLAGYPHESEGHALMSDWAALGVDFQEAIEKVVEGTPDVGVTEGADGPAGRKQPAR